MIVRCLWPSLFLLLLLASCSEEVSERDEVGGVVYGIVADKESGEPLQGVNVKLYPGGKSVVTGHDGHYEFSDLQKGTYIIQFSKEGYLSQVENSAMQSAGGVSQVDGILAEGEHCLDVFLGELDFGEVSSGKTFVISNTGEKTIHWNLFSDYNKYLDFDIREGTLAPGESIAVNVHLVRTGASSEINSFPIYVQAGGERLGAIATVNRYNGGKLNSLILGTWILKSEEFWQKDMDDIIYNDYNSDNAGYLTLKENYTYEHYVHQFVYDTNVTDADKMFTYRFSTGSYAYDPANGILQIGEYGPVYSVVNLSKEYLELEEILMQNQERATVLIYKRK